MRPWVVNVPDGSQLGRWGGSVPRGNKKGVAIAATTCGEGVRTPGLELLNQAQGDVIGEPAQHLGVAQAASVEYAAKVHGMPGIVERPSTLSLYACGISRPAETA